MEDNRCRNCFNLTENNFCSNCGQSVKSRRLNFHYLVEEFQHTVLHADKGIVYTVKELFVNPDKIIRDYIQGKRVKIFKPFGFLIILASINGFLSHFLNITYDFDFSFMPDNEVEDVKSDYYNITHILYSHYSVFLLLNIFPLAFFSKLIFKKSGYNYIEYLVVNAYIVGQQSLMCTLLIPLFYLFPGDIYFNVVAVLSLGYFAWVYAKLFTQYDSITVKILKSLLVVLLYYATLGIVGGIVGFVLSI